MVKDTLPWIPPKILPLTSNTLIPWLLPLSGAVLGILFQECREVWSQRGKCCCQARPTEEQAHKKPQCVFIHLSLWTWVTTCLLVLLESQKVKILNPFRRLQSQPDNKDTQKCGLPGHVQQGGKQGRKDGREGREEKIENAEGKNGN